MRKLSFFSTVLTLFLLVPASIIWAQITKAINGTVSYRSGISETKFTTPNGNIIVSLPESMTGAIITGTVRTELAGKNEKERKRNLNEIEKLIINMPGKKIPLSATQANFDWPTEYQKQIPGELILARVSSGEVLGKVPLGKIIPAPAIISSSNAPLLTTPSNLLIKGDALNVYTDQQFIPGEKFVLTDSKGQQFTVKPVCMSANQAVITVPDKAALGVLTIVEEVWSQPEVWNQPSSKFDISRAHVNMIDINLTSPNTNLRPGQKSSVIVLVEGANFTENPQSGTLNGVSYDMYNIDLRNLNPNTVTMEGGNLQRVSLNQFRQKLMEGEAARIEFHLIRNITGNAVGSFSVSATLHEDYSTCNDPFRPQLNVLKTPEDFNAWVDALKKDLKEYAGFLDDDILWPPNTQDYSVLRANTQRAIDNMPVCTSPEQLDESKAVVYSLLQPLNVPKGAANTWLSSFEAFNSSIASFSGTEELSRLFHFNTEVAVNGLDFMERVAWRSNDQSMVQDIANARKAIDMVDENTEANKISLLNGQLQALSLQADKKITTNVVSSVWKLSDLLFSAYCINKRTKDGIDPIKSMIGYLDPKNKVLKVKPDYQQQVLNSLNAVPSGSGTFRINSMSETRVPVNYDIRLMPFERTNTFDSDWWAEHLIETVLKKDTTRGNIITTSKDSTGTYYVFYKDAKCEVNSYAKEERTSGCMVEEEWDGKEQKSKPTGRYKKITCYKTGSCRKGTDFCTEAYLVSCITQIYMDANCTKRLKTFDFKHFSCL